MFVVVSADDGFVDGGFEGLKGGEVVGLVTEGDLELVVVAVAEGVVALAECCDVIGIGECGVVESMGGGELELAGESDHGQLRNEALEVEVGGEVEGDCGDVDAASGVGEGLIEQGGDLGESGVAEVGGLGEVAMKDGEGVVSDGGVDVLDVEEVLGGGVEGSLNGDGEGEEGAEAEWGRVSGVGVGHLCVGAWEGVKGV